MLTGLPTRSAVSRFGRINPRGRLDRGCALQHSGSDRHAWCVRPEARIPYAERLFPLVVQDTRANLQQEMGAAFGPLHLLFLYHPLAHDLVHRRFDKARANAFALVIALALVLNKARIVSDICVKLLHGLQEFPGHPILTRRDGDLQVHGYRLDHLQALVYIPMPQKPFQPLERPPHRLSDLVGALAIASSRRESFGCLVQHGQAHRIG
jgi:hypothetical protein